MAIVEPLTAEQLRALVAKFIESTRAKAAGGLTVQEFGSLVIEVLRLAVTGLESIPTDKSLKKAWAVEAVAALFDEVADRCVPVVVMPFWWIVRPAVRALVLSAASGALEQVLSMVRDGASATVVEIAK